MITIKSYHSAKQNTTELVQLYAQLIKEASESRIIIQFDDQDKYCMVQLMNDDGTPLANGVRCWISANDYPTDDDFSCFNVDCIDDVEALVKLQSLIQRDDFREAWLESF